MTDYVVSSGQTLSGISAGQYPAPPPSKAILGDSVTVENGGTLVSSSIGAYASGTVQSGGVANITTLNSGSLVVLQNGVVNGTSIQNYVRGELGFQYGAFALDDYGSAINTTVTGGSFDIEAGAVANLIVVNTANTVDGFLPLVVKGAASNVSLVEGNAQVAQGGTVTDAYISSGQTLQVVAGGTFAAATRSTDAGVIASLGAISVPGYVGVNQGLGQNTGGAQLTILAGGTLLNGGTADVGAGGGGAENYAPGQGGTLTFASGSTLANSGTITVEGGPGGRVGGGGGGGGDIVIAAGANITNSGSIALGAGLPGLLAGSPGQAGVLMISNGATFTNSGAITASPANVSGGPYASGTSGSIVVGGTLVLDPGQVLTGSVQGNAGSTLELAGSGSIGTLSGLGGTLSGFGTLRVAAGADWALTATNDFAVYTPSINTLAAGTMVSLGVGSTLTEQGSKVLQDGSDTGSIIFQGSNTLGVDYSPYGLTLQGFDTSDTIQVTRLSTAYKYLDGSGNNPSVVDEGGSDLPYRFNFTGLAGRNYYLTNALAGTTSVALNLEPIITALAATPSVVGPLNTGSSVTFNLTTETALAVGGDTSTAPTLLLNDGSVATFDRAASTSSNLVFHTSIVIGDAAPDLKVTGLSLNGGAITDALGIGLDVSNVAGLAGSDTGIAVAGTIPVTSPPTTPTPPATVTGGVTVLAGAGGTVFITPKAGSDSVTATATGNDTVISQGTDTIQAGGGNDVVYATGTAATVTGGTGSLTFEGAAGNDLVVGGSGSNAIYGGSGTDTFFGGTGPSILVAGSGAGNLLLAGVGNTSLVGGLGKAVMMFGGPGIDSFTGSSGGNDIMVGGAGGNSFSLTNGDIAFGGPIKADIFTAGNGTAMITTGSGGAQVNLGSGTLTSFEGSGAVNYNAGKGEGGTNDIVGFTVHDHITLTGGFTAQDASSAFTTATKGSFGTTLSLTDGTKITIFGINLTATQVSVG